MSPSILDTSRCVHCEAPLEQPTPRACPQCGGSLQRRFLRLGCLSSAPLLLALALGARALAAPAPADDADERAAGAAGTEPSAIGQAVLAPRPARP